MNRERMAWLVSIALLALLAFQLPGSLAQRDDDYSFVRTLVEIHRQVAANYVEPVDEDKLREGAIDGMLEQLDPYSVYVPPKKQEEFDRMLEGTFKGVGIQLDQADNGDIEVVSPIEDSPAFKAGVLAGDVILSINGKDIKGKKLKDVIADIGNGPLKVTMRVRHLTGEVVNLPEMTRQEIVLSTVKGYQRKPDSSWDWFVSAKPKIGYVRITQFTPDTFDKLKPQVQKMLADGMQGLVLDLRFNPGGRLDQAEKVVNLFVKDGVIVVTRGRARPEEISRADPAAALPEQFPMVVLVNEHSASASEIVAGSLMDNHRALVLGSRSYGKGSVQEVMPMDGTKGGELKLTVAYYYLPSGRLVHRKKDATDWGVDPQVNVPMDANDEKRLVEEQSDLEIIGRPPVRPATKPSTAPTTSPASQPAPFVDHQLEAAVSTLVGHLILDQKHNAVVTTNPTTQPEGK
jgi:carboxyl-terminal processing protease